MDSEGCEDLSAGAIAANGIAAFDRLARTQVDGAGKRSGSRGVKSDNNARPMLLDHPHRALEHAGTSA